MVYGLTSGMCMVQRCVALGGGVVGAQFSEKVLRKT